MRHIPSNRFSRRAKTHVEGSLHGTTQRKNGRSFFRWTQRSEGKPHRILSGMGAKALWNPNEKFTRKKNQSNIMLDWDPDQ